MLNLVAPVSMSPEDRLEWVSSAVDALEGITAQEVAHVSAEVRRSITRHNQVVPAIADAVAKKRARPDPRSKPSPFAAEMRIGEEARQRRAKARTAVQIEEAWAWERQERISAGLAVPEIQKPFGQYELERLPAHIVRMGLKSGFLKHDGARLVEVNDPHETERIREQNRKSATGRSAARTEHD